MRAGPCSTGNSSPWSAGVEGAHRGQARRHGCRDGRLHGRGARGNVIDEPTAPQNLELGQVDLIKTEDLSDRWPQGEAHRGQAHMRSALLERDCARGEGRCATAPPKAGFPSAIHFACPAIIASPMTSPSSNPSSGHSRASTRLSRRGRLVATV